MTRKLPPKCKTVAKLHLAAPNSAGGIRITQGQWDVLWAWAEDGVVGERVEDVIAYMLQKAIIDGEWVLRRRTNKPTS